MHWSWSCLKLLFQYSDLTEKESVSDKKIINGDFNFTHAHVLINLISLLFTCISSLSSWTWHVFPQSSRYILEASFFFCCSGSWCYFRFISILIVFCYFLLFKYGYRYFHLFIVHIYMYFTGLTTMTCGNFMLLFIL